MCRVSLPPGFRFCPSDQELVLHYLKRKNLGKPFLFDAIAEVDIYQFAPEELPDKSCLKTRDQEWYFFCPRDRKYSNGRRTNRSTCNGCWKITGKDRPIRHDSRTVGKKKTLIFYSGKKEHSCRTDWVIHEYMLEDPHLTLRCVSQDKFVLCKLYRKTGLGPRQHVPPFEEEEGEDDFEISSILSPWMSVGQQFVIDAIDQPVHPATGNMETPLLEPDTPGAVFAQSHDPNDNISPHSDDVIDSALCEILCDDNGGSFVQDIFFESPLVAPLFPDNTYNGIWDNDRPAESVHQVSVVDGGRTCGIPLSELEETLMSCGREQHEYDTEPFVGASDSWYLVAGNDLGSTLLANSVHSFGSDDDRNPVAAGFPTNEHWASQEGYQPEPESQGDSSACPTESNAMFHIANSRQSGAFYYF